MQYFCGCADFDDSKPPFNPSSIGHFRKCLTLEILAEINEMVIQETKGKDEDDDDKPGDGGNSGTIIVGPTSTPSSICYAQDASLLNETKEKTKKLLDSLHSPAGGKKPCTYCKCTRKDYLKYSCSCKHTVKITRKAIGKQLNYLKRDMTAMVDKLSLGE